MRYVDSHNKEYAVPEMKGEKTVSTIKQIDVCTRTFTDTLHQIILIQKNREAYKIQMKKCQISSCKEYRIDYHKKEKNRYKKNRGQTCLVSSVRLSFLKRRL